MTKLKRILGAAAALVTTGTVALGVALLQANQTEPKPMTCKQWAAKLEHIEQQEPVTFFVAIKDGFAVPSASSSYVLGDCAAGICTVKPKSCDAEVTYRYRASPLVGGWRLFRVDGPRYFALGWKQLAAEHVEVRFAKSFANVRGACLAKFTGAQCRAMIDGVNRCWLRPDGQLCRGLGPGAWGLYGPGHGGDVSCIPGLSDVPFPCDDEARGQAWAMGAPTETWPTDEELDLQ